MLSGRHYYHDRLGRPHFTDPVHHPTAFQIPAPYRLFGNLSQRTLGHTGIVLQKKALDLDTLIDIAHQPDETDQGADPGVVGP
jgi:hypothetical protein